MKMIVLPTDRLRANATYACMLGLLIVWNIPHTIAARYLFACLLFIPLFTAKVPWSSIARSNAILIVFSAYLVFQLFVFSTNFQVALDNFTSEWLKLILFSALGAGTGLLISKQHHKTLLLVLALAFATPLIIHLVMAIPEGIGRGEIPWGYFGLSGGREIRGSNHGDLGYGALPAAIFVSVFVLYQATTRWKISVSLLLLCVCVASPLLASSRAATAFVFVAVITVLLTGLVLHRPGEIGRRKRICGIAAVSLGLISVTTIGASVDQSRWTGVVSRITMGFKGDPVKIMCEGVGSLRQSLEREGQAITPEASQALSSIQDVQDGSRIMAARAGAKLAPDHPMGINQSRQAYQIAIGQVCDPDIFLSHTHNGWIDTALAIGIPGAILYLLVLLNFARLGLRHVRAHNPAVTPFAIALLVTSIVWILRSLVDSAQRDQVLEAQIFTMCFLYGTIVDLETNTRERPAH